MNWMWPFNSDSFEPKYTDPTKKVMPYLQQIPGLISPYYQPYIDTGNQALQQYFGQLQQLANPQNIMDVYNQFGKNYQTNPGTQSAMNAATKQTNQLSASSGMFGSPSEQQAVASQIEDISYKNFNSYMSQLLGQYGKEQQEKLGGEEGLTNLGYKASSELSSDLAKNLMSEAGLTYAGIQGKNKMEASKSQDTMKLLGSLLGFGGSSIAHLLGI